MKKRSFYINALCGPVKNGQISYSASTLFFNIFAFIAHFVEFVPQFPVAYKS